METDSRTQQTRINYYFPSTPFGKIIYPLFRGGFIAAKKTLRGVTGASERMFGWGVESMSHKVQDGSIPSQRQSDEEDGVKTPQFSDFPEGEMIDLDSHDQSTTEDTTEEKSIGSSAKLLGELKNRVNELGSRNSNSSSSSLATSNLPVDASLQVKYMDIMRLKSDQTRGNMDGCLERILELNETNKKLSQQTEEQSKEAADIKEKSSQKECSGNKWQAWGQFFITLGGISGSVSQLPFVAACVPLAAAVPVVATIGAALGVGCITISCVLKGHAALLTRDSEKIQADVQTKRDEQGRINTEISTLQNEFSISSQLFNTLISIWQAMIAAENDVKRAIISSIR
ncbi:MAG: hypothetical protein LBD34_01125 [Puniceicoccales bacterium]|jgi:hypothetical protein|nr:hypothetical protein [Puniceicoccales bacterium]